MNQGLTAQTWDSRHRMKGWGVSCLLHAGLAMVALSLMPKMTVLVQQEPFKWDVAMVEPPREVVRQEEPAPVAQVQPPAPAPVKPRREPVKTVEPTPQPVQRQVETRVEPQPVQRVVQPVERVVQAVQREPQPVVEAVRPQEQVQPPKEVIQREAVKHVEREETRQVEPVMQATAPAEVTRETVAAVEKTLVESAPVTAQTYAAQPVVTAPAAVETRSEPVVTASAPVERTAPPSDPTPPASTLTEPAPAPVAEAVAAAPSEPVAAPPAPVEPVTAPPAPAVAAQPDPATLQEHQVVARMATPRPATKADYGWLAESLHRRIIELRHYPSTARLNGWEGKVVLKVSIKKDGQLKDVEVVKSSGYDALDQAAMEAVRRACPLHMKHELAAPMVVLHLPVSYSLNR
ncbi:MAG: hypothetical protein AMXMBFR67_04650 [Nitrospira sp.]